MATAYFEQVAAKNPSAYAQYELGIAYENIAQYGLARQAFEKAVVLAEDNKVKYRLALARVCERTDCHEISFAQYCLILEQEPDHKKAWEGIFSLVDQPPRQTAVSETSSRLTLFANNSGYCV